MIYKINVTDSMDYNVSHIFYSLEQLSLTIQKSRA